MGLPRRKLIRGDNSVSKDLRPIPRRQVIEIDEKISERGLPFSRIKAP